MKNKRIFCRSSHSDVFCSKIFGKAYRKTRVQEPFFKKIISGCRPATLFKKRLMHRFFSVKLLNFFKTAFLYCTRESLPMI